MLCANSARLGQMISFTMCGTETLFIQKRFTMCGTETLFTTLGVLPRAFCRRWLWLNIVFTWAQIISHMSSRMPISSQNCNGNCFAFCLMRMPTETIFANISLTSSCICWTSCTTKKNKQNQLNRSR